MKLNKNEKGHALLSSMIFIIITSLIFLTFIEYIHIQYKFVLKDGFQLQSDYYAESCVYRFIKDIDEYFMRVDNYYFDGYKKKYNVTNGYVNLTASPWGGFIDVYVKSNYKNCVSSKHAVIGQYMTGSLENAIVFDKLNYPLMVTGSTQIVGDVCVGAKGVRPATLKGIRYKGEKVVYGSVNASNISRFSDFKPGNSINYTFRLMDSFVNSYQNYSLSLSDLSDDDNYLYFENNFNFTDSTFFNPSKPCTVITKGSLTISGNFKFPERSIIVSNDSLVISGCELDDALVYGKHFINIKNTVTGKAQFFSEGQIEIDDGTELKWPCLIYVNRDNPIQKPFTAIKIGTGVKLTGSVILWTPENISNITNCARIEIEKTATIQGMVFTNLVVDMSGNINGHISLACFYLYYSPTNYINWLLNARIDREILDDDFPVPVCFGDKPEFQIIKWQNI